MLFDLCCIVVAFYFDLCLSTQEIKLLLPLGEGLSLTTENSLELRKEATIG